VSPLTTYLIRHGRTDYSARYLVNGDPARPIQLDEEGVRACHAARSTLPVHSIRTWIASAFARAQQTAVILKNDPATCLSVNPLLNELGYGAFESAPFLDYAAWLQHNGPWIRPPEAGESQREGIRRMVLGLLAALEQPGPRIVVAHGLLLSVFGWHMARTRGAPMPLFFPEAPYLVPLVMSDDRLADRASSLLEELDAQVHPGQPAPGDSPIFGTETAPILATFDSLSAPLEEKPPHA
jgi:2,3-bisphosphoglycerate-dependent phosphoglycerate mutase